MALLLPFRPLRPTPAVAARVAAVPYDVVSTDEARALASDPLSFLHVSRPEIDLPVGTDPHADLVYERAATNFVWLSDRAPLVREDAPRLYAYRLQRGDHIQTGVAGCVSVAEYDQGIIKRHELTRPDKEDDRTRHIGRLRAQTGPVFLLHKDSAAVAGLLGDATTAAPLIDFTAVDGVRHSLWPVASSVADALVTAFAGMPALYIADGHHRAASASRVSRELGRTAAGSGESDRFLAVAFAESEAAILPYNRVVLDLGQHTPPTFLAAVRERCDVEGIAPDGVGPEGAVPSRRGEVGMFVDGRWHRCTLPPAPAGTSAAEALDVSLLQASVLGPVLGIGDVRTDPRIGFVGGARGTSELEAMVRSGRAAVAFSMFPVAVADLMAISDQGGLMPPKSTWFEPKLRDGLLIHAF